MINTSSDRPLKILFVAQNPNGGAGLAAHRLFMNLRSAGLPVRFLVLEGSRPGTRLWDEPTTSALQRGLGRKVHKFRILIKTLARTLVQWFGMAWQDRFLFRVENPFEILTLRPGHTTIDSHPWFQWADVVHLHWTAGFLSSQQPWQKKKWVISLHDCHPFTAVCHFPGLCRGFESGCKSCPQLKGSRNPQLSGHRFQGKARGYQGLVRAKLHAPSQWIAEAANRSLLLGHLPVSVLPNFVPTSVFRPLDSEVCRQLLDLPKGKKIALFVAGYVSNMRKGFSWFLDLAKVSVGSDWCFVVVGSGELKSLSENCIVLGALADPRLMAAAYSASDLFLTTALQDNAPSTVIEAQLCGTPISGFGVGGLPELIDQGRTGWLSLEVSVAGLLEGLRWLEKATPDRSAISRWAHERWDEGKLLEEWVSFYRGLV